MTACARSVGVGGIFLACLVVLTGCRSTPTKPASAMLVDRPVESVQKAAVNALVVTGFDITRQEPLFAGGAGQKNWNQDVLRALQTELERKE